MNYGLKEKIVSLREKGISYRDIEKELRCSRSTVCYHLGDGQKEKSRSRRRRGRKLNPLQKKADNFRNAKHRPKERQLITQSWGIRLKNKCGRFRMDKNKRITTTWNDKDLLEKVGKNPTCYLTGESLDLEDTYNYHTDHIIPKSRGGDNSLENCGLATKIANEMKGDQTVDELIRNCKKLLEHQGYIVSK